MNEKIEALDKKVKGKMVKQEVKRLTAAETTVLSEGTVLTENQTETVRSIKKQLAGLTLVLN